MAQEKRTDEETPLTERDTENDFSSGPLAEADDADEINEPSDSDEEMLDDAADEEL